MPPAESQPNTFLLKGNVSLSEMELVLIKAQAHILPVSYVEHRVQHGLKIKLNIHLWSIRLVSLSVS